MRHTQRDKHRGRDSEIHSEGETVRHTQREAVKYRGRDSVKRTEKERQ